MASHVDKSAWGDGPWNDEPDEAEWLDEATGLPCRITRSQFGNLCGYVGVAETHAAHGEHYNDLPFEVHGGLTFAGEWSYDDPRWWLGFDCGHAWDVMPGLDKHFARALRSCSAFPTTYKTMAFVRAQCEALASQLALMAVLPGAGETT